MQERLPRILIARTGERFGLVIATMPAANEYTNGARLAVGSVYRISHDDSPEKWRAWLWPIPGGAMHVTQHCDAVDAGTPVLLCRRIQERADQDGPWWDSEATT
jgi:hypothetical protein